MTGVFPTPAIRDVERIEVRDTVFGILLCVDDTQKVRAVVAGLRDKVRPCTKCRAAMKARCLLAGDRP